MAKTYPSLNKKVWVDQLMENFYPDSSFLKYGRDFSSLTEYDVINMLEAGLDPVVLVNNKTYPITTIQRIDTPIRIELDKFETEKYIGLPP